MLLAQDSQQTPQAASGDGGESFLQRMRRVKGQQNAAVAGVPQGTGAQASPYQAPPPSQPSGAGMPLGAHLAQANQQNSTNGMNLNAATAGTPVTGDGKIPPPAPTPPPAPAPIQRQDYGPDANQQINRDAAFAGAGAAGSGQAELMGGGAANINYQQAAGTQAPQQQVGDAQPGPELVGPTHTTNGAPGPSGADPFAAMGGGVQLPTGEWVPKNHPLAQAAGAAPGGGGGAPGQPGVNGPQNLGPTSLGNNPFSTYNGSTFNTQAPQGYKADQFDQFSGPNQSAGNAGVANIMQAILGNPESMGAETVNQMKNAGKETALLQAKQNAMRAQNSAAARGTAGGGAAGALDRRINDNASGEILRNNRDIDVTAAKTNFGDRINAMGAADSVLNNQMGRETSAYDTRLRGQTAQAGANQAEADSNYRNADFGLRREGMQADENFRSFDTKRGAEDRTQQRQIAQADIDRAIAGHNSQNYFAGRDANRSDRSLDLQGELGRGGMALDRDRLNSANSQFEKNFGMNIMDFMERRRQGDNATGYNYAALNQNGQQNTMDTILRMIGR